MARHRFKWNENTLIYKLSKSKQKQLGDKMVVQNFEETREVNLNGPHHKPQISGTLMDLEKKNIPAKPKNTQVIHEVSLSSDS